MAKNETNYISLLKDIAQTNVDYAKMFAQQINDTQNHDIFLMTKKNTETIDKAEKFIEKIQKSLISDFITPINRSDIYILALAIEKSITITTEIAVLFSTYNFLKNQPFDKAMSEYIKQGSIILYSAISALGDIKKNTVSISHANKLMKNAQKGKDKILSYKNQSVYNLCSAYDIFVRNEFIDTYNNIFDSQINCANKIIIVFFNNV